MSKAYDRVEWVFLERMMLQLGFATEWVSLIMLCVSFVSFSVLINRTSSGFFQPSRGIRQGEPFSSYLFQLCAKGFCAILNQACVIGSILGITLSLYTALQSLTCCLLMIV